MQLREKKEEGMQGFPDEGSLTGIARTVPNDMD